MFSFFFNLGEEVGVRAERPKEEETPGFTSSRSSCWGFSSGTFDLRVPRPETGRDSEVHPVI